MIKKLLLAITVLMSVLALSFSTAYAQQPPAASPTADNTAAVCDGISIAGGGASCTDNGAVSKVIGNVINVLSFIIGIAAVIMIMLAGFRFITANGDAGQVSSARNTIIYAIIGLVVAALAQVIVKFVLGRVATGK